MTLDSDDVFVISQKEKIVKMWDDIIYVGLLLVSIAFGKVTRQVQDKESRKWTSSLFGLIVVLVVSGWSTLHTLASVVLHTILIKFSPKSLVHWINFVFGFAYLIFFRSCGSIEVCFTRSEFWYSQKMILYYGSIV